MSDIEKLQKSILHCALGYFFEQLKLQTGTDSMFGYLAEKANKDAIINVDAKKLAILYSNYKEQGGLDV